MNFKSSLVVFGGAIYRRIEPKWVRGYRPAVTYVYLGECDV